MKDFQLDFPCVSFKEKGETAESERPGERVNWKVWFEMSGTFPLAFFADLLQKKRVAARSERSVYIARRAKCTERERLQDSLFRRHKTLTLRRIDSWKSDFAKSSPRWEQVVFASVKIIETHVVRSRFRRTYACYLSWIFSSENGSLQINWPLQGPRQNYAILKKDARARAAPLFEFLTRTLCRKWVLEMRKITIRSGHVRKGPPLFLGTTSALVII